MHLRAAPPTRSRDASYCDAQRRTNVDHLGWKACRTPPAPATTDTPDPPEHASLPGPDRRPHRSVPGMCGLLNFLPSAGRDADALAIAEVAVAAARAPGNPFLLAYNTGGVWESLRRGRSRPSVERRAPRARLRRGASRRALGSDPRRSSRRPRSRRRGPRPGAVSIRFRHRVAVRGRQCRSSGHCDHQAGRGLRSHRTARACRHPLWRLHPPRQHRHCRRPPRLLEAPAHQAGRAPLR
jgi:hypothetical protein